jgi:S-adenosylmethionine:tRNA ribosyltransferase-isomerase
MAFSVADLDYELPTDLIAQEPTAERDRSRLLVLGAQGDLTHRVFRDLPELLPPRSLVVLNDTRVIRARLFGRKNTGGEVELLLVERLSEAGPVERWAALGHASKGLREGQRITVAGAAMRAEVIARREGLVIEVELRAEPDVASALARGGHVPLPPYVRRPDVPLDHERYQTVYARRAGSVAAPTAGLHFTDALLAALRAHGHEVAFVTLHVGPGTFRPIRDLEIAQHRMHPEAYDVPQATADAVRIARAEGRAVVAVGTTVVRTLEAAAEGGALRAGEGRTALFIHPPYAFRAVDVLVTNFHLPRSTLLALVMAFAGVERVREAYRVAVEARYRFYSYGDAMLVSKPQGSA